MPSNKNNKEIIEMEKEMQNSGFVAYEYLSVEVASAKEALYADCYKNFGWIPDGREAGLGGAFKITLKFKRDRKIARKQELVKLQSKCENSLKQIERLENSKTAAAMGVSIGVGFLGTAALAGSMFCFLAPLYVPFAILGAAGLALWAVPYFIYKSIKKNKTIKCNPIIDKEYDVIYDICEQGNKQLALN